MIGGLDAYHIIDTGLTLNDLSAYPMYRLHAIPGLLGVPPLVNVSDKQSGRMGRVPRRADRDGRIITYEGVVEAQNLTDLRTAIADLCSAFRTTDDSRFDVQPWADTDVPDRFYFGRVLECTPSEDFELRSPRNPRTRGQAAAFSIIVECGDPRYYHPTAASVGPGAGPLAATNNGNCDTEAIISISGTDMVDVTVTNDTLGVNLILSDMPNVEDIVIDSKRRTIKRGSGTNLREYFDPESTWWDMGQVFLQSGTNSISVSGTGVSTIQVDYNHADIS